MPRGSSLISNPVSIVCAHQVKDDPLFRLSPKLNGHGRALQL